jgi:calcium-dependent protein kinase
MSAAYIMYQIFRALFYCHSTHHLMHRDIKPENIVVFKENNTGEDLYGVKLIDFGIAKIFNKLDKNKEQKIKGSFNYIAPEVIKRNYDEKCDIWSCGVILYILVIGTYPFNGNDKNEILYNIEHGNYTFPEWFIQNSSPQIKDLIQQCLKVNPSSRISAKQALEHPFFELYEIKEFFINVTESFLNKTINNIKNYKIKNSLQELTFTYLVHNYPNQYEITLLYRVFNKFNICNDGKLTKDELKNGLMEYLFKDKTSREASEKEANIIFEKLD